MVFMKNKQLVNKIKSDFEIWGFLSPITKEVKTKMAKDMPFIRWPNNKPCIEANLFILSQFNLGFSRKVNGGTLRTYAYHISHIINYCSQKKINITGLTDNHFTQFICDLGSEIDTLGVRVRENNQVITIGRTCINFLFFLKDFYSLPNFIGVELFNSIKLEEKRISQSV